MTLFDLSALQASAGVLVGVVVLLILTGQLVPRRTLNDRIADRDARIELTQEQVKTWQRAYELAVQSRRAADGHVDELMLAAQLGVKVLGSLPPVPETEADPDAHSAA